MVYLEHNIDTMPFLYISWCVSVEGKRFASKVMGSGNHFCLAIHAISNLDNIPYTMAEYTDKIHNT